MNGRKLFRQYAQSKGKVAKEFIQVIPQFYSQDIIHTRDDDGNLEITTIDYKEMVHWIIKTKPN